MLEMLVDSVSVGRSRIAIFANTFSAGIVGNACRALRCDVGNAGRLG